ncbi:MAG: hypothetical protein HC820_01580 [Hydrococcus sp. RM1_1_31]|nr:hypothetical protein [Hydrococcus sp. RM1_1_31]
MNKQNYDAIAKGIYLSFTATFPIAIIITPTHPESQILLRNVTIALYLFCLVVLVLWMALMNDLFGWKEKLPSAPVKYRLRIESSNVESKYILESQKPGNGYWSCEGVYREMEAAIERQQELESRQIHKVQIIKL